jgi:hypothetical protein
MEDIRLVYGHSVYFADISCILWPFDLVCGHFGIFSPFWIVLPKNLATLPTKSDDILLSRENPSTSVHAYIRP